MTEGITHLALKDAKTSLKDVHDRVVQPFPVVDNSVIMDSGDNVCRSVIFTMFFQSLLPLLRFEPAPLLTFRVFYGHNLPQKFNVARREKIEASVHIDDALTRSRRLPCDEFIEDPGFAIGVIEFGCF